MKRNFLSVLTIASAMMLAGFAVGRAQSADKQPAAKPQKMVKVATINSVQANKEFQTNVQLLQTQRQTAIELNAAMEKEKDAKKKQELKARIDAVIAKLNENNAAMQKAYGFSLTRNYTMEVEVSHVYMLVTDEEAAKIEQAQKAQKK